MELSTCAPLFIIPNRPWFGLVGTTFRGKTPLGCNILQMLNQMLHLTLQSTFHGEGAKQMVPVNINVYIHVNV